MRISIFIIGLLCLSFYTKAETYSALTLDYPPYSYKSNDEIQGISTELSRYIFKKLSLDTNLELLEWKRSLFQAENGKADFVFNPLKTPEREEYLLFTDKPLLMESVVLITNKLNSNVFKDSLEHLYGKRFCIIKNFSVGKKLDEAFSQKQILKTEGNNIKHCAKLLLANRVYGVFYDRFAAIISLDEYLKTRDFVISPFPIEETASYFAVSKKGKYASEFKKLNTFMNTFYESSEYKKIIDGEVKRQLSLRRNTGQR